MLNFEGFVFKLVKTTLCIENLFILRRNGGRSNLSLTLSVSLSQRKQARQGLILNYSDYSVHTLSIIDFQLYIYGIRESPNTPAKLP